MASFISNLSSRGRICVREGIRVSGGGYIFTDRGDRFMGPATILEIDYQRIDHLRIDPNDNVKQTWRGAELVVQLWVEGYDNNEIVTLEPAGSTIQALNTPFYRTEVRIYDVRYTPGTSDIEEMRYLTSIYADNRH